jgi:hypothetical protein
LTHEVESLVEGLDHFNFIDSISGDIEGLKTLTPVESNHEHGDILQLVEVVLLVHQGLDHVEGYQLVDAFVLNLGLEGNNPLEVSGLPLTML